MQIHELNKYTGALGSGAYLAIDNGSDTGKLTIVQLLQSVNDRIDNIISSPAPSEAEIIDAREAYDGKVYTSLGEAIREQFDQVFYGLDQVVYSSVVMPDNGYWYIPYNIGQTVICETINGQNLSSDLLIYSYDSSKAYQDQTRISSGTNSKRFISTYDTTYLKCASTPEFPIRVTVIDSDRLVYKVGVLGEETTTAYTMSDVYERKEVSSAYNMYEHMTAEVVTRARAKQQYLQKVPDGATSVDVKISAQSLASGKYKVGWAFYTSDYKQISGSVKGWYTADASFVTTIPVNAVYFMLYYAVNSAAEITLNEIDTAKNSIIFDNSKIDYAKSMLERPANLEIADIKSQLSDLTDDVDINIGESTIYSINHRGYNTEAPENTIPAFIMSKKKGFTYVECDVQFTSDGIAVILHDASINRTARNMDGTAIGSTVNIADITYAQALNYDFGIWKGAQWAGTPIPTFDEFIVACKKLSLHPFIELKDSVGGNYWTDARVKAVADSIKSAGMDNNVSFISFAVTALEKMIAYFPNARVGLGFEGVYSVENFTTFITNAQSLMTDEREVVATVNYASMDSTLYSMLGAAGINPVEWTINTKSDVLGIDDTTVGVLSDSLNAGKILLDDLISSIA